MGCPFRKRRMMQIERHTYKSVSPSTELQFWCSIRSFVLGKLKGGIIPFKCYSQPKRLQVSRLRAALEKETSHLATEEIFHLAI